MTKDEAEEIVMTNCSGYYVDPDRYRLACEILEECNRDEEDLNEVQSN